MPNPEKHWTVLTSDRLTAAIDPLGAQLSLLRDAQGLDLLWNGDPAVWAGRAPLLFPIVGALEGGVYRLGSKSFPLSRHGFARGMPFDLLESSAAAATFRLSADSSTRMVYPFEFELDVRFALLNATLMVAATVRNTGLQPLPASFGFHPALRWPLPYAAARAEHFIEFAGAEPAPIRRLGADGLLSMQRHVTPVVGKRLMLADELFRDDVIIFDGLVSRSLTYGAASGPRIEVSFPDATYLGLWTKVGAGFICIEPWQGIADPQGYAGDFTHKPGAFLVAPGAEQLITMAITWLA